MQNHRNNRARPVQAPHVPAGRSRYASDRNDRKTILYLTALCLLIPPVGVMLVWRTGRISIPVRAGLSGAGFLSMMLIFCWFMRPAGDTQDILPVPQIPAYAGYGQIVPNETVYLPAETQIPAQPDVIPENPQDPANVPEDDPGELTNDSTVYAVTNNASKFHLDQYCDFQENNRTLTLIEAVREGLQPCDKCIGAEG